MLGGFIGFVRAPSRIRGTKNSETNHFVVVHDRIEGQKHRVICYDSSLHTRSSIYIVTAFHFIMTSLEWK